LRRIALIPARKGSERVPDKNIRKLGGHPLLAYAIRSAIDSGCFDVVVCSSDDRHYLDIAESYGAKTIIRQFKFSEDLAPDIGWVKQALDNAIKFYSYFDAFSILRPTAPFRTARTIQIAVAAFDRSQPCDSVRAVSAVKEHPYKMWQMGNSLDSRIKDNRIISFMGHKDSHNQPYQSLPRVFIQNASLEVAWTKTVYEQESISGRVVMPFHSSEMESYDINTELDFKIAELLLKKGVAKCQKI